MTFVTMTIGTLLLLGLGLALYEWRKRRIVMQHDLRQDSMAQTEAGQELERNTAAMRDRIMFDHMS